MTSNPFKRALLDGRPQIGFWLSAPTAYTAEICAGAGFDWLLIDGEHAPNHIGTILSQLQAIAAYPSHPVVRPLNSDPDRLKQLLDIGVTTLLVPMVDTAEQARSIVEAVRYPPAGRRGIGHVLGRATRWGRDPDYFDTWSETVCVLVQIETAAALDNIEAIAAVDGVDGLFIGPADLAGALGRPNALDHPEVVAALRSAQQRIVATGKPAGTIAVGEAAARRFLDAGGAFVAAGVDVLTLSHGADALRRALNGADLGAAPTRLGAYQ